MSTGGAVAGTVAAIAAKKREEIFERFRQRGALSASTAKTREELDLGTNPMFRLQAMKGAVVEISGGRYYLDQEAVARQQRSRRILISTLLGFLILMLLILWLAG